MFVIVAFGAGALLGGGMMYLLSAKEKVVTSSAAEEWVFPRYISVKTKDSTRSTVPLELAQVNVQLPAEKLVELSSDTVGVKIYGIDPVEQMKIAPDWSDAWNKFYALGPDGKYAQYGFFDKGIYGYMRGLESSNITLKDGYVLNGGYTLFGVVNALNGYLTDIGAYDNGKYGLWLPTGGLNVDNADGLYQWMYAKYRDDRNKNGGDAMDYAAFLKSNPLVISQDDLGRYAVFVNFSFGEQYRGGAI